MNINKKVSRLLSMVLVTFLMVSSTVPVLATGSVQSVNYWSDLAEQIISGGGIDTPAKLATQLSVVAGSTTYNDGGTRYPVIVVSDGTTNFVGGGAPDATIAASISSANYTALSLPALNGANNTNLSGISVMYYTNSDEKALHRINANTTGNLLNQANVRPDTGTAMNLISGIMPMVNTLLGLIVVVISVGMTVFSALDIIYLAFPAFRTGIDTQVESNGRGTKTNKDGSTSSRWVTDDARQAMEEAQTNSTQPWGGYLKRRAFAYVFLAIILFILLTGNIFAITTLVTNALQGLFSSLGIG